LISTADQRCSPKGSGCLRRVLHVFSTVPRPAAPFAGCSLWRTWRRCAFPLTACGCLSSRGWALAGCRLKAPALTAVSLW